MATTLVLSFVEGILSELGSLSVPFLKFVFCFNIENRKLMNTLTTIRALLLDAEKQQEKSHTNEDWLGKLQDILYDAEDLVEELTDEVLQQQVLDIDRNMGDKFLSFFSNLRFYIVMAFKMKTIRERLNDVAIDKTKFHPMQQVVGLKDKNIERKEPQSYKPPIEVIGREDDKKVIKKLLNEYSNSNERNVSIISIIGIGGVGKTTLARLVFDDEQDYNLKMWVWVSPDFDVERLVKKVIEAATDTECPNLGINQLQSRLRKILEGKKYLLVLDDVWNKNLESWIALENLLKGGARGSVILVTTRERDVEFTMDTVSSYELRGLYEDNSWFLFEQQMGFKQEQMKNLTLLAIGGEILKQCGGIPLAITTVAGLLRRLNTESEWLNVKNELWALAQEDNHILPSLRVSYAHLSSNLKKCFAYCSLFPKGYEIKKGTLIQLWMAQGFLQPSNKRLLEDIGDEYFKELWNRSFLHDEKMDEYGNIISCKMHDLMHDLAQTVAGCEYCVVNDDAVDISERLIHASIFDLEEIPPSLVNARKLRTFFRPWSYWHWTSKQDFDKLTSTFKSLRVLDLCVRSNNVDLSSIGELKHLRYLDLFRSDITKLSDSVCELQNLQTLKLYYCENLVELPRDIKKLVSLRHLENKGCDKLKGMPLGTGQLTSIQTLSVFVLGNTGGGELSELEGLNNLRGELEIRNLYRMRNATCAREAYLKEKKYLQSLTLNWGRHEDFTYEDLMPGDEDEDAALLESLQPNPNLNGLYIRQNGGFWFPSWMVNIGKSLPHLVKLTLEHCSSFECFPLFADQLCYLKVLKLSHLHSLKYIRSYISDSSSLSFKDNIQSATAGWFPALQEVNLQEVNLWSLRQLKEWSREIVVGDDCGKEKTESVGEQWKQLLSLSTLSNLTISHCPELTSMPLLPDIKELMLYNVSEALIQSMTVAATISPSTETTSSLSSFLTLPKLKSLVISSCNNVLSLQEGWLENHPYMEYL